MSSVNVTKKILKANITILVKDIILQSWSLALFFQVPSPLNFYPWIAIAPLLILRIFRFTHRSIAPKMTYGSLLGKNAKTLNPS